MESPVKPGRFTQQVPDFVESGNCRVACHMVAEMLEDRRLKEETL
jgi:peptide/nickel transport system ATP-binding protein|nr:MULTISPECIES: hypothetical protein [Halomonas]